MPARPRIWSLAVLAVLCASLAGCAGGNTDQGEGGPVGDAKLQPALLQKDDLPAGFKFWTQEPRYLEKSDNAVCLTTLQNVLSRPASAPGSTEARVAFSAGDSGPWLTEVIRNYTTETDAKDLIAPLQGLTKCTSYSVTDSNGTQYAQSVKLISATADQVVAEVSLKGNVYSSVENLVVIRLGSTVITLSHFGASAPPTAETLPLADKAVKRARDSGLGSN